jgi:hypothetical protein
MKEQIEKLMKNKSVMIFGAIVIVGIIVNYIG